MATILNKGFKPKPAALTSAPVAAAAAPTPPAPAAPVKTLQKPAPQASAPTGGMKFLKRGAAAQQVMAQEEKSAEMRSKSNIFRFWVPKDGAGCITFLDGDLKDGVLDIPFYHEHNVNMNGNWNNHFICTQDEEPCPICEGGSGPSYVGIFTVIDHSEYVSKKDNKTHKDNVKLFVAKRDTIKLLQTYATKRGGLRGCKFDVVRVGDKAPAVGSGFDFTEKLTPAQLHSLYKEKAVPTNYDQYLAGLYQPASELRKLGFGSAMAPIGAEAGADEKYDV